MSRILDGVSRGALSAGPLSVPLVLACSAAVLFLLAASVRDFWSPDEPDFAEHVREMLERKDLVVPYQNGKPYSEKPILFYWAMAASSALAGGEIRPALLRLPSVLSGAFLVFGASWLAGRRGGRKEALLAGAITAVSPIVFWQAQFLQIDALFTALLFGALLCQLLIDEDISRASRWRWGFQVLLPLAVLTKGPLALVLVGLATLVRAALERSWRPLLAVSPLRGALVGILIVVPWYVAASRAGGPVYTYDLIVNQNWNRFFHAFDHIKPWWFYLESIWGDFFPWTIVALAGSIALHRAGSLRLRPELRYAAVVCATTFLFLSVSQSKQAKYLLIVYPFAAVLAAAVAGQAEERARDSSSRLLSTLRKYILFVAALLFGAALVLVPVARRKAPGFARLAPLVALPLLVGSAGTVWVLFRRRTEAAPALLALAATLACAETAAALTILPALDVIKTGRPLYERMRTRLVPGAPLASFGETYHCYPILVLRRFTEQIRTEAELALWVDRNPSGFVLADESERTKWTNPVLARLAVVDRQRVGQDAAVLLQMR